VKYLKNRLKVKNQRLKALGLAVIYYQITKDAQWFGELSRKECLPIFCTIYRPDTRSLNPVNYFITARSILKEDMLNNVS